MQNSVGSGAYQRRQAAKIVLDPRFSASSRGCPGAGQCAAGCALQASQPLQALTRGRSFSWRGNSHEKRLVMNWGGRECGVRSFFYSHLVLS